MLWEASTKQRESLFNWALLLVRLVDPQKVVEIGKALAQILVSAFYAT